MHVLQVVFLNNLTNYLYFYNKKLYLILNASVRLYGLHTSIYKSRSLNEVLPR